VYRKVGPEHERERPGDPGVFPFGLVEDAYAFDDLAFLVREEGPLCPEPGPEGGSHPRRVGAHADELAVVDRELRLEPDEPAHVFLIPWAEKAASEDQDQRIPVIEA